MRVSNIEYFYVLITASPLSRVMQNILDKSSAVAEMAAKCCTIRTVKRWGGSVFGKIRREAPAGGHQWSK